MIIIKRNGEKIFKKAISVIGALTILPIFIILIFVALKGIMGINFEFLFGMPTDGMRSGGIFPAIIGSIYLTLGTILFSVPFGIFTGVYLVEYAKDTKLTRFINLTIINLAGIPSIIYGLFGMALFVIFLNFGSSILSGSLTLLSLIHI